MKTALMPVVFLVAVVVSTWSVRESTKVGENQELDKFENKLALEQMKDSVPLKSTKRGCFIWSRYNSVRCRKKKRQFFNDAKVTL